MAPVAPVDAFVMGYALTRLQDEYNLFLEALLAYKDMEASVALGKNDHVGE